MTEKEYKELKDYFDAERIRKKTPEEARAPFIRLGILDNQGNPCPGYEELVAYLDYITSRPEFDLQ